VEGAGDAGGAEGAQGTATCLGIPEGDGEEGKLTGGMGQGAEIR